MSTYREIHGKAIKSLSTDPSATTDEGQIWYNTASDTFKTILNTEAFVSQTNMPTKTAYNTSFGQAVPTTVSAGGMSSPGPAPTAFCFEFNGSGWTTGGALPSSGRESARGFGTQTAGTIAGGSDGSSPAGSTTTSEYDGSSWTAGGALPTSVQAGMTFGTQTQGLYTGGRGDPPSHTKQSASYTYNGSSWSSGTAMPSARQFGGSSSTGPQTSAIVFNGQNPSNTDTAIEWDGSSWSSIPAVTFTATQVASGGVATAALAAGGDTPPGGMGTASSKYDGTSWTAGASLATGRRATTGQGATGTTSMVMGGDTNSGSPPQYTTAAEEYNSSVNVITAAAWASGTAVNTGRYNGFSTASSPPSALLFFGGTYGVPGTTTNTAKTEEYNGTAWAEQTDMPGVTTTGGTGGTQTAAISMGGYQGASLIADCFSYNGSSWGTIPSLPTATGNTKGCGTSTAGLLAGGKNPGAPSGTTATYEYDGEGWASGGAMSTPRWQCAVYGIQTAAVASGGQGFIATTEEYGGSSWTSGGALITASGYLGSNGAQTDGLVYAGETSPAKLSTCVGYDGTAYSTRPSMATGRMGVGNGGGDTSATAVAISGDTPQSPSAMTTAVEEFTGETSVVNVETLTQS